MLCHVEMVQVCLRWMLEVVLFVLDIHQITILYRQIAISCPSVSANGALHCGDPLIELNVGAENMPVKPLIS